MKLPNAEAAFIDIRKLRDYSLNPDHDRGKHKARLFLAILGLDVAKHPHHLDHSSKRNLPPSHELLHPEINR
jgi:hypothetical protein